MYTVTHALLCILILIDYEAGAMALTFISFRCKADIDKAMAFPKAYSKKRDQLRRHEMIDQNLRTTKQFDTNKIASAVLI